MKNRTIVLTWVGLIVLFSFWVGACALEPRSELSSVSLLIKAPKGATYSIRYLLYNDDKYSNFSGAPNYFSERTAIDTAHYPASEVKTATAAESSYNEQLGGYPVTIEAVEPHRRMRIALHLQLSGSEYYYFDGYTFDYNYINNSVSKFIGTAAFDVEAGQTMTVQCDYWSTIYS
jgi:hypothetical protein